VRFLKNLDLGDQVAGCRIPPEELDAVFFTDQAASSVAPDEIFRRSDWPLDSWTRTPEVVLRETGHLTSAIDRHAALGDPPGQDALDLLLLQRVAVGVGVEVADVQRDPGEPDPDLPHVAL
jgi:hypothetical protein